MGKGMFLGALSGLGNAAADIGKENQRVEEAKAAALLRQADEERMLKLRADASVDMQNRLAEAVRAREEADLEKAGGYLKEAYQPVPMAAERVTAIDPNVSAEGYKSADGSGMPLSGSYEQLKAALMTAPDDQDRAVALELLNKRFANTQAVADKAVEGKTVRPSADQALQIAVTRAMEAGDTASAAALKKLVETKGARYLNTGNDTVFDTQYGKFLSNDEAKTRREQLIEAKEEEKEARRDKRQADLIAERQRAEEARAERSDVRADEREAKKDERLANKPLAQPVIKSLQETRDNAVSIHRLKNNFKDEYADQGVMGIGADASMGAKAIMGWDKDAVAWWKNYKKDAELVERHAMFGASLTVGEQAAWRAADISSGMDPEVIKTNLATRAELAKTMLENTKADYIGAGYSEKRISLIVDRGLKQIGGGESSDKPAASYPAEAAAYLKANPNFREAFDAKYGAGASKSVLGN